MTPENKKKTIVYTGIVTLVVAVFMVADYFGLFGVYERTNTEFVEFSVRTVDAETGRPVSNVKVRCFQYTSNNACGQPPTKQRGVVRISLLVEKHVLKTLLFKKKVWYTPVNEDELRVMFIHTEYQKPVKRYNIPELMQHPEQTFTVEMSPLVPASEKRQENDS